MTDRLCTLTITCEDNKISIIEGTIFHELSTDLMSKSKPIVLAYNINNDKTLVSKGSTSKVKTTSSSYVSASSVSSNDTEETPAEASKGSDSSIYKSIFSRNESESSTELNTFTSLKIDEGWRNY